MTPGITFDSVWKKFRRGERHDSLKDVIPAVVRRAVGRRIPAAELETSEFWAVRDVSFAIGPGEALGIIGPNGAGKSTTLKLLTRILRPTKGVCAVRGRVGALIEVAAGFHPDLTGRENIYLQGAIMGMRRAEIRERFDDILEFAGIGDFIDTQVKRYSSGMNARLGFAIAASLNPEVMIIDEVLSVGDTGFQDRCVTHMRKMVASGVPMVFVSHNLPAILDLCTRVIVINKGTVAFDGAPADGVQHYRHATATASHITESPTSDPALWPIHITQVELLEDGAPSLGVFRTNSDVTVRIHYRTRRPVQDAHFHVDIHRGDGIHCFGTDTHREREFGTLDGDGAVDLRVSRLALLPGCYAVSAGIHSIHRAQWYDWHSQAYPFSIASDTREKGIVHLEHEWDRPRVRVSHIA
jgi:lipopolysaccharide transport system ATP-binding protein